MAVEPPTTTTDSSNSTSSKGAFGPAVVDLPSRRHACEYHTRIYLTRQTRQRVNLQPPSCDDARPVLVESDVRVKAAPKASGPSWGSTRQAMPKGKETSTEGHGAGNSVNQFPVPVPGLTPRSGEPHAQACHASPCGSRRSQWLALCSMYVRLLVFSPASRLDSCSSRSSQQSTRHY